MSSLHSHSSSPLPPQSVPPRHITAAERAHGSKRSAPPPFPSSPYSTTGASSKHPRTESTSTDDENVDSSNLPSHSTLPSSSPTLQLRNPLQYLPSSLALSDPSSSPSSSHATSTSPTPPSTPPSWCECGHCTAADDVATPYCCWHIEPAGRLPFDSAPLCERDDVAAVIRDGVSTADFDHYCTRIRGEDRPASFSACNAAQKRLMVYAVLHRMLYQQGSRGHRDPLPECIKHMVRSTYVNEKADGE